MSRLLARAASALVAVCLVTTFAVEASAQPASTAQAGSTAGQAASIQVISTSASKISVGSGCELQSSTDWSNRLANSAAGGRVIVGPGDEAGARSIANNAAIWRIADKQLRTADGNLTIARPKYNGSDMDSFIKQGRTAANAAISLLYGSATTGNTKYLQRVKQDALDFAAFPDWGPSHFLGVAEVAAAVALEYSMTSQLMTAAERTAVKDALISKAIAPATCLWQANDWQVTAVHNWGVVTNAGIMLAALAIAADNRELSAAVIAKALPLANRAIDQASDGGSPEGPAYADYIAKFTAYITSSFYLAFGQTGLSYVSAVPKSAQYWNAISGASRRAFNYGDSNADRFVPLLPILNARTGGDPVGKELAKNAIDTGETNTLLLLWYAQTDMTAPVTGSLAQTFPASGFSVIRSTATPAKTWLAVRGGSNAANHAHLDLGSFVLEMQGTRFVSDLGADNYSLPNYFSTQRGTYSRVQTANHSTVSSNYQNQPATALTVTSPITKNDGEVSFSLDMAAALGAKTGTRQFTVDAQGSLVVRDTAEFAQATQFNWTVITTAQISLSADRTVATLTLEGKTMQVRIYTAGATFKVADAASSPSPGYSNAAFQKLEIVQPTEFVAANRYRAEAIVGFKSV